MRTVTAAIAVSIILGAGTAIAADDEVGRGFHLRIAPEILLPVDAGVAVGPVRGDIAYKTGWGGQVALGHGWRHFAFEIEAAYAHLAYDRIRIGKIVKEVEGQTEALMAFANGYILIRGEPEYLTFFGFGAGAAHQEKDIRRIGSKAVSARETGTDFAVNGTAGINWHPPALGGAGLSGRYRFYWIKDGGEEVDDTKAHVASLSLIIPF